MQLLEQTAHTGAIAYAALVPMDACGRAPKVPYLIWALINLVHSLVHICFIELVQFLVHAVTVHKAHGPCAQHDLFEAQR